ncbi:hypothetical protein HY374_00420 [Candidatus Berkelbacteria bacterium]|nr:hypothetical protein [Candidatus Berkelbacteria bacterium]
MPIQTERLQTQARELATRCRLGQHDELLELVKSGELEQFFLSVSETLYNLGGEIQRLTVIQASRRGR